MKKNVILIPTLIFSVYLTGCARNNVNDDVRNRNVGKPTVMDNRNDHARLHYNNPNYNNVDLRNPNRGPAMSTVDDSRRDLRNARDNNINDINNVNNDNDNRSKMRVADQAADKVSDLPEVDTANVIVTENNAFVAVKLDKSSNKLTNDIEGKISKTVKSVDPDIDNVYVSENPAFFKQMNDYARDIRNGRPVSGFFKEFTDAVRRVFPNLK